MPNFTCYLKLSKNLKSASNLDLEMHFGISSLLKNAESRTVSSR